MMSRKLARLAVAPRPEVTKLQVNRADSRDMDRREIEPRVLIWATAEISWRDPSGAPCRAPATLEDTSKSGACIRVKRPFDIGAALTVRWHREQFSAVAKNCRKDGRDYLLGVHREAEPSAATPPASSVNANSSPEPKQDRARGKPPASPTPSPPGNAALTTIEPIRSQLRDRDAQAERISMDSKTLIPKFWRRPQDEASIEPANPKEVSVNKSHSPAEAGVVSRAEMLSYDDIYHAAGILSPRSGYGIHKVVEMLNSDRLRDLSKDIKRASVLMALDAAGTSVDELLHDATRRREALDSYEAARKKQLEEFEAGKARENSQIEAEMERIRAHYALRVQRNRDLVAQEKEALRNWQMAMQHESERITEVLDLCGKQPELKAGSSSADPHPKPAETVVAPGEAARGTTAGRSL